MQLPQACVLLILLCLLMSFMVNKDTSPKHAEAFKTFGDPRIQFLLANVKLGSIDILVNDRLVVTSLANGQLSGYLPIRHDHSYTIEVRSHQNNSLTEEFMLDRYHAYTVIAAPDNQLHLLDDSSWHFVRRSKQAPVLRLVDLTEREHALQMQLCTPEGEAWFTHRWLPKQWTDWMVLMREGPQELQLWYNATSVFNTTVSLHRSSGFNFFLLADHDEKKLKGFARPAFLAAPLQYVAEYTFCISVILLIWCNVLHRLYMSMWFSRSRAPLKPVHARTLPSIREVNMFIYSLTMTLGFVFFVCVSYSFLEPVGLLGVWEGLVHTELTMRLDYYQNYFKAMGVMIVVLYAYEVVTDLRMPLSTLFHHVGAIGGTVFLINFTDEIAEFWFGWISLAYVQFELVLYWGLWLRDYSGRTGRARQLSEQTLVAGWLLYMAGVALEMVFYAKALFTLSCRVTPTFLYMSVGVMSVWLVEQLMCLCCTARSIKRKDLLRQSPLEWLCWFSWWVSRHAASLAKFNLHLLNERWDQIPKIYDEAAECAVTVHALPFCVWIPSAFQKDEKAKLKKVRLQAADQLQMVANTLLPEDLSGPITVRSTEHYSVNEGVVDYGT